MFSKALRVPRVGAVVGAPVDGTVSRFAAGKFRRANVDVAHRRCQRKRINKTDRLARIRGRATFLDRLINSVRNARA